MTIKGLIAGLKGDLKGCDNYTIVDSEGNRIAYAYPDHGNSKLTLYRETEKPPEIDTQDDEPVSYFQTEELVDKEGNYELF